MRPIVFGTKVYNRLVVNKISIENIFLNFFLKLFNRLIVNIIANYKFNFINVEIFCLLQYLMEIYFLPVISGR